MVVLPFFTYMFYSEDIPAELVEKAVDAHLSGRAERDIRAKVGRAKVLGIQHGPVTHRPNPDLRWQGCMVASMRSYVHLNRGLLRRVPVDLSDD